jgi:hypothetical protein
VGKIGSVQVGAAVDHRDRHARGRAQSPVRDLADAGRVPLPFPGDAGLKGLSQRRLVDDQGLPEDRPRAGEGAARLDDGAVQGGQRAHDSRAGTLESSKLLG